MSMFLSKEKMTKNESASSKIPLTGNRTTLATSIQTFLKDHPKLQLGGAEEFTAERKHHLDVFGIHNLPKDTVHSIGEVEFTAIRGPHGTIPIHVFYPKSGEQKRSSGEAGALIYFHGGGYTVGSVDEFENGLRFVAEESGMQVNSSQTCPVLLPVYADSPYLGIRHRLQISPRAQIPNTTGRILRRNRLAPR
jgi:hypothetical protein